MKDEFLATMSHELRTPLQAILGYASMLEHGVARDPEKAIAAIVRNAAAQTRLVEDILDVARITSGKLRLIDEPGRPRGCRSARPSSRSALLRSRDGSGSSRACLATSATCTATSIGCSRSCGTCCPTRSSSPSRTDRSTSRWSGSARRCMSSCATPARASLHEHLSTIFERFRQLDSSTTRAPRRARAGPRDRALSRRSPRRHGDRRERRARSGRDVHRDVARAPRGVRARGSCDAEPAGARAQTAARRPGVDRRR